LGQIFSYILRAWIMVAKTALSCLFLSFLIAAAVAADVVSEERWGYAQQTQQQQQCQQVCKQYTYTQSPVCTSVTTQSPYWTQCSKTVQTFVPSQCSTYTQSPTWTYCSTYTTTSVPSQCSKAVTTYTQTCCAYAQQTSYAVSTEQYVQETVSAQYTSYYGESSSSYYYRAAAPQRWYSGEEECTSYCWVPVQTYETYQCSQEKKKEYSYPCQTYEQVSTTYQCGQYESQQVYYQCQKYKEVTKQECQYVQESYCVEYEQCQQVTQEVSPSEIVYYGESSSSSSYYY